MGANMADLSRRTLLKSTSAVALGLVVKDAFAELKEDHLFQIYDPDIRAGFDAAVNKNLLPSATELVYPGHFTISADGHAYGTDTTWPGLDSWQMAGAYLLLGKVRLVTDYFDFVRASQRKDGNIPFAIFNGDTRPGNEFLRGMKVPEDLFTYKPPHREGLAASSQETRQWVGLFRHWEIRSEPLSTLGPICYLLTATEIYETTKDGKWIEERLPSIQATAEYLTTRVSANGLLSGSGFYTELPPRWGWDGVTQCYAIHAFRELSRMLRALGHKSDSAHWSKLADQLAARFVEIFWQHDHFAEYVHIERGVVDAHGLSDTNWAAVAFGVAHDHHLRTLWPKLIADPGFWVGGMPTQTVTNPFSYEEWERDPVPFGTPPATNDVAAMGRTWYLEAVACKRLHAFDRLREGAKKVSKAAEDGFWRERYHPKPDHTVEPAGGHKYCEYPAILARVVLTNPGRF